MIDDDSAVQTVRLVGPADDRDQLGPVEWLEKCAAKAARSAGYSGERVGPIRFVETVTTPQMVERVAVENQGVWGFDRYTPDQRWIFWEVDFSTETVQGADN